MAILCKRCRFDNPVGTNYCGNCGTPLTVRCPACGNENPAGFKFCGRCGKTLLDQPGLPSYARRSPLDYTPRFLVDRVLKTRGALVGERKLVSVLFADVANFTAMSEKLDPEAVHEIMDGCFEILGREIHGAGGTINQYTGDGVMALFGAPIAYDDHIRLACHAALRVQRRLGEFHKKIRDRYHVSFKMRIGIHSGPVVVGAIGDNLRLDYTAQGDTTNLAARLQSLAKPGEILVSEPIHLWAGNHFIFQDGGMADLKGKEQPVRVFVLLQESPDESFDSKTEAAALPYIGHQKEIAILKRSFEDALSDGPRLVAVTGEAGLGKTRLLHHFIQSLQDKKPLVFEGRCMPYGQAVALYPLRRMLRSYFHISDGDSFERARIEVRRQAGDSALHSRLDQVIDLLQEMEEKESGSEMVEEAKKRHLFRAIRELLVSLAALRPVIMAVQNMQWVDATTREFFSFVARSPATSAILLVCMGRSDPEHWVPGVPDHLIRLHPLSEKESLELFSAALGGSRLDSRTRQELISKAGGNPLFLFEMAETLKRQDLIVCGSVRCKLTLPVKELEMPESIQGILAARLDSLPPAEKELAQLASVIGTRFSMELLLPLVEGREDLDELLEGLEQEGIIMSAASGNGTNYQFTQQMMQEVAYHGLLRSERRNHHQKVAETMEALYRDSLNPHIGVLAHHFYEAQEWKKAFGYFLKAGGQARRSYACQEALTCFDRALELLSRAELTDKREISLQLFKWKGGMHYCLGQMKAGRKAFEIMYSEARRLKDQEAEAESLFRIGWISCHMHEPSRAEEFLRKAIDLSEKEGLDDILLKALSSLGFTYAVIGRLNEARPLFIRALDLSADLKGAEGRAWLIAYLLYHYNWTGEFEEALNLGEELFRLNQGLKSPYFNIFLLFNRGLIYGALGQTDKARENLESGLKQIEVGDNPFWRPRFLNTVGWVLAEEGKIQEALKINEQSFQEALDGGDPETLYNAQINLGENYLQLGNLKEARQVLEGAWREIKKPGVFYTRWRYKTRLFIALADLYRRLGERRKGFEFIRKALHMAEESGAKKHQARALFLKGQILAETRPGLARNALKEALTLSKQMGASLLTEKVRLALDGVNSPGRATRTKAKNR